MLFGQEGSDLYTNLIVPTFKETTENIAFLTVSEEACADKFGVPFNKIVIFRQFDSSQELYTGQAILADFNKWVDDISTPSYSILTRKEVDTIFGKKKKAMLLFMSPKHTLESKIVKEFMAAAPGHKNKYQFAIIDQSNDIQNKLSDMLGVTE